MSSLPCSFVTYVHQSWSEYCHMEAPSKAQDIVSLSSALVDTLSISAAFCGVSDSLDQFTPAAPEATMHRSQKCYHGIRFADYWHPTDLAKREYSKNSYTIRMVLPHYQNNIAQRGNIACSGNLEADVGQKSSNMQEEQMMRALTEVLYPRQKGMMANKLL